MYSPYEKKDLKQRKIEELWPGAIAYGFPAYVNGSTNLGKTTVFLKIAADVTRGIFPSGIREGQLASPRIGEPINVFYVSTENPVLEIVYPALLYNGADMSRIKIQREDEAHFELCTEDLTAVMEDFAPRLIIIDAFQEHLPDGFDLSDGRSMSKLMRELEAFAYKHMIALVLIGNDSKGPESRSDANKMLGSGVIARRARSLITLKKDGRERYLSVTKHLGFTKQEETRIGFRFGSDEKLEFYAYGGEDDFWDGDDEIDRFLIDALSHGPLQNDVITEMAEKEGFTYRQIYTHKDKVGVDIQRSKGNKTTWSLK